MPNGSDLTDHEYRQLQIVFASVDKECDEFARATHADYSQYFHGTPKRDFVYRGDDEITRLVTISLGLYDRGPVDESGYPTFLKREKPDFLYAIAAWKDGDTGRRSWHRKIETRSTLPEPQELRALLERMFETVNSIGEQDLA